MKFIAILMAVVAGLCWFTRMWWAAPTLFTLAAIAWQPDEEEVARRWHAEH